jgi:hypothetical protein
MSTIDIINVMTVAGLFLTVAAGYVVGGLLMKRFMREVDAS